VTLPSQFGRYTLLERLAVGGMAEVFRAKIISSHGFEKILVIKRILPHLAADATFVSMFIDEAKLTAQLTHPKIVQILDFGDVGGQYFIALEYIDGSDALGLLRTSAQRRLHVPRHLAVFVINEMLEALDYAHNARDMEGKGMHIVHRDISPSNIFLSKRGDVKLGDFGIAHAQRRESKTQAGTLKGKYGYMSPEQVVGQQVDGRSDLFGVGVVLAEMLMGRRLFTAANDLDVLLMVRDARIERLAKYCRDLPPALDRIVRRALQKDPRERFPTAAAFRDALGDYLYETGQRVGPPDLRAFLGDLHDPNPEAAERLSQ
jgi:eukaryotic-like serine/threonine-protein kinase